MGPKSLRRLLGAALLSLICSVSSFAQSYTNWGDLERAREGSEPHYRPFDIGASFGFDMVIYQRVDFNVVFDFGVLPMFRDVAKYHWCDVLFRVGFWI